MATGCNQVNIPTTDNTDIPCEEYVNAECVIVPDAIPFIGSTDNDSLDDVIALLVAKIKQQQQIINNLVADVSALTP